MTFLYTLLKTEQNGTGVSIIIPGTSRRRIPGSGSTVAPFVALPEPYCTGGKIAEKHGKPVGMDLVVICGTVILGTFHPVGAAGIFHRTGFEKSPVLVYDPLFMGTDRRIGA